MGNSSRIDPSSGSETPSPWNANNWKMPAFVNGFQRFSNIELATSKRVGPLGTVFYTAFYPNSMRYSWLAKSLNHPDPVVRFTVTMSKIASGKTHQHRITFFYSWGDHGWERRRIYCRREFWLIFFYLIRLFHFRNFIFLHWQYRLLLTLKIWHCVYNTSAARYTFL
jgi:hypothetical protein